MNELKTLINRITEDKKSLVLAAAAVICFVLLLFSGGFSKDGGEKSQTDLTACDEYSERYVKSKQKEIENLLCEIDGAGEVRVMITLESRLENIYSKEYASKNENGTQSKSEYSEEYVTLKKGTNSEEALVSKVNEPQIKGVAVVAQGGDSAAVKKAITDTVCAVFGISSTRVSVEKMKKIK